MPFDIIFPIVNGDKIQHFQGAARAYLRRKGRYDEDVLSQMTLYALEHPKTFVSVENAYLRAIDKLDPRRVMTPKGKKERLSRHTITLDPLDSLSSPVCEPTDDLLIKHGPLRAMLLLLSVYGYSMEEVAWLFGMTPSRLFHLLGKGKAEVLAGAVPERDFVFAAPSFDLPWMRL